MSYAPGPAGALSNRKSLGAKAKEAPRYDLL